jgi:hypothetical protein
MKMYELDQSVRQDINEGWSQKYKSSINCSHPKGFSQKAHCAGKKKHNESVETEMTCPDCGMCKTHGSLNEIAKGAKDSNGFTKCWPGKHAEGTKKGKNGGQVRNCVPNESQGVAEGSEKRCQQCGMTNCSCKPGTCKCKPIAGWIPNKGFKKAVAEGESNAIANAASRLANKDDGKVAKLRAAGDKRREDQLKGRDIAKRDRTSKDAWGDLKQGVEEGRFGKDAYERDYDASVAGMDGSSHREFKRREMEHELGHETNNYAVSINGKTWKVFGSRQEANRVSNAMERKYPDKKIGVHATGAEISESATLGATSAANVGVGAVYKNKPVSQPKNKNGTAKNALDMKGANLLGGGSIKR